jgi:membrane protein implicated in regulation of membrane protease activity
MITCPWCGTNYVSFQSNCDNCGGSLPLPAEMVATAPAESLAPPPPPPRNVPRQALWRILFTDGWSVAGAVFSLLGFIFGVLGTALTVTLVAAFVGLPFAGLGVLFLGAGIPMLVWRYQMAYRTVEVLEQGEATVGEIVDVYQNYQVRVNGRYPWTVQYRYEVGGREYSGRVTTLSRPDLSQQPGRPVYVLHMQDDPGQSTLYPSPYGYYGL